MDYVGGWGEGGGVVGVEEEVGAVGDGAWVCGGGGGDEGVERVGVYLGLDEFREGVLGHVVG